MAISIAHLAWAPVSGATGYLIEYKLSSSSTWLNGPALPNPTLYPFYDLVINQSAFYDYRITTYGQACTPRSRTGQIFASAGDCCPATFTLAPDGTYCQKTTTTAATPPTTVTNTIAASYFSYGSWGTLIYNPGWNINGTGSFTQISGSNPFWINGAGYPGVGNFVDGPVNRCALWATTTVVNQTIGFSVCLNVPVTKQYYLAIAGDNIPSIKVDGVTILAEDPIAMGTFLAANGFPFLATIPDEGTFRFWHVFPLILNQGTRVVEMLCTNTTGPAALAAEIYDATASELISATSYAALAGKLLFSTKDYIGQPVQVGTGGIGYTCPAGYSLVLCDGPAYCKKVDTAPLQPCP